MMNRSCLRKEELRVRRQNIRRGIHGLHDAMCQCFQAFSPRDGVFRRLRIIFTTKIVSVTSAVLLCDSWTFRNSNFEIATYDSEASPETATL